MTYKVKIAESQLEKEGAWNVRHNVFCGEQGINSKLNSGSGLDVDLYDTQDTTKIYIGLLDNKVICTMRLNLENKVVAKQTNTDYGLPIEEDYVLKGSRFENEKIKAQVSRIAILKENRKGRSYMPKLLKFIANDCKEKGIDYLLGGIALDTANYDHAMKQFNKYVLGNSFRDEGIFDFDYEILPRKKVKKQYKEPSLILDKKGDVILSDIIKLAANIGAWIIGRPTLYEKFNMYHVADYWRINDFKGATPFMKKYFNKKN